MKVPSTYIIKACSLNEYVRCCVYAALSRRTWRNATMLPFEVHLQSTFSLPTAMAFSYTFLPGWMIRDLLIAFQQSNAFEIDSKRQQSAQSFFFNWSCATGDNGFCTFGLVSLCICAERCDCVCTYELMWINLISLSRKSRNISHVVPFSRSPPHHHVSNNTPAYVKGPF